MLNIAWSVLVRGRPNSLAQCRRVTPAVYKEDAAWLSVLNTLAPDYRTVAGFFRIEQLVQLVLRSRLRERLLAFDPVNTYEKATLTFPPPGFAHNCPLPLTFLDRGSPEVSFAYTCLLIPSMLQWSTPEGETTYTVTEGLTSALPLSYDKALRLRGPFGEVEYRFDVAYTPRLEVDWTALKTNLQARPIPWQDAALEAIWRDDFSWVEQLAAVIQAVIEANANVVPQS
jgi:hypothetical protein